MAKENKTANQIAFRINKTIFALNFDNISWMYAGVFYGGGIYDYTSVKYSDHNKKDSWTIKFKTEEQASQLIKMFEEYCKSKYNYCDELCVIQKL
jgi:hypothetical protein